MYLNDETRGITTYSCHLEHSLCFSATLPGLWWLALVLLPSVHQSYADMLGWGSSDVKQQCTTCNCSVCLISICDHHLDSIAVFFVLAPPCLLCNSFASHVWFICILLSIRCLVLGIWCLVPGTWCQLQWQGYLKGGTWRLSPGAVSLCQTSRHFNQSFAAISFQIGTLKYDMFG